MMRMIYVMGVCDMNDLHDGYMMWTMYMMNVI